MFDRFIVMICVLFFGLVPIKSDASSWCQMQKPASIKIVPKMAKIGYDYSKSFTELSNVKLNSNNPYGSDAIAHTFGIANGRFQISHTARLMSITNPNTGQTCTWYDTIDVNLHMSPVIMIAKEYKKGGCHFNEVMAHEREHVEVDRQVVNEYAQKLGVQLLQIVNAKPITGPFPTAQKDRVRAQMEKRLQATVAANNKAMMADRSQRQAQIDSKENYDAISERIHGVCDKRSPMTAKRVRRKL